MFTDHQPQSCLGFAGNNHILTPNLDQLASRGTYFDNAFVTTAICCSSRVGLLTAQHMMQLVFEQLFDLEADALEQHSLAMVTVHQAIRMHEDSECVTVAPSVSRIAAMDCSESGNW